MLGISIPFTINIHNGFKLVICMQIGLYFNMIVRVIQGEEMPWKHGQLLQSNNHMTYVFNANYHSIFELVGICWVYLRWKLSFIKGIKIKRQRVFTKSINGRKYT